MALVYLSHMAVVCFYGPDYLVCLSVLLAL